MEAARQSAPKPQVLFVDDEQRVLNSMRIMFRRDYNLHLASSGSKALEIIRDQNIDVVVADHRMPRMTGVELLTTVRSVSPRTVRILLTGYADLDAVEGSINDGEVFRFLTKPCPPNELRETVALATDVAQRGSAGAKLDAEGDDARLSAPTAADLAEPAATPPAEPASAPATEDAEARQPEPAPRKRAPAPQPRAVPGLSIAVFTNDEDVLAAVQQSVGGRFPVYSATNIVKVIKILTEHKSGVLVTDISDDKATIQSMTATLKEHLPELVTIAVSPHRDVLDMVWLINHGQVFRFLRKPLSAGRCAACLQSALKHHRMLLRHPELVQRHQVESSEDTGSGVMSGVMDRLKNLRRLWVSA